MRTICITGVGLSSGQLLSNGITTNNTLQWVLASVILVCFIGYIVCVHNDFIKEIKKLKN